MHCSSLTSQLFRAKQKKKKTKNKKQKRERETQNRNVNARISAIQTGTMCLFGQLILLFNLFLLLFMGSIALFGSIHGSHCIISTNIYLYLQYFQQKIFNFDKINGFQVDLIYDKLTRISKILSNRKE